MKFGINCSYLFGSNPGAEDVFRLALRMESLGFSTFELGDHIVIPNQIDISKYPAGFFAADSPWYDPFVLLGAIAGATKNISLGVGVSVVPYRPPVQQAQAVATLDFISGGRFRFGVGLGWMSEEFDALNVPFAKRALRTREYIEIMKILWSGSEASFHGECIDFPGGRISPLPVQKPHPPIIIGGDGLSAFRRIVKYGNGFQLLFRSAAQLRQDLSELELLMTSAGREMDELIMLLAGDVDQVNQHKEEIPELEDMGVQEIVISPKCSSVKAGFIELENLARQFL